MTGAGWRVISRTRELNMLMSGPPDPGKILIAHVMPSMLPSLSVEETLDVTRIYSIADKLSSDQPLIRRPVPESSQPRAPA